VKKNRDSFNTQEMVKKAGGQLAALQKQSKAMTPQEKIAELISKGRLKIKQE